MVGDGAASGAEAVRKGLGLTTTRQQAPPPPLSLSVGGASFPPSLLPFCSLPLPPLLSSLPARLPFSLLFSRLAHQWLPGSPSCCRPTTTTTTGRGWRNRSKACPKERSDLAVACPWH